MRAMWTNRYMVALAVIVGMIAGLLNLHGDLFVLLMPTLICVLMVAVRAFEARAQSRRRSLR